MKMNCEKWRGHQGGGAHGCAGDPRMTRRENQKNAATLPGVLLDRQGEGASGAQRMPWPTKSAQAASGGRRTNRRVTHGNAIAWDMGEIWQVTYESK